ncbi:MAG TPA: GNAT family N-acetyltransferase [Thioalkalivibrio sp.]|nr:GNAT family N-acetyltransferase [Thioalkalivibrio sp.]
MTTATPPEFRIRIADWAQDGPALAAIRRRVFIEEQRVPEALEWDGLDVGALHLLAEAHDGTPIGTTRLLADGHIGRMAVLAHCRGRGVGTALLMALLDQAQARGLTEVFLHAQTHAIPFYTRAGFLPEGAEFMDAGIPHRQMRCRLAEPA